MEQFKVVSLWMCGLRAGIVDAWPSCPNCGCVAFVPYMCSRPSSQHLSCRFWKPPRAGEVLPKFCTYSAVFFVLQSRTCRRELGAPRLVSTATLGIIELFPYRCRMSIGVAQLGVSRPKQIQLEICESLYIFMTVSVSDCPRFLDSPRIRRCVSFHALLGSEMEFRHHLLVVLRIHTLPSRTCIGRAAGRCCRNFVSDQSRAWKLTSSTHPRVGLGPILTY
jgi:hypothetical protein